MYNIVVYVPLKMISLNNLGFPCDSGRNLQRTYILTCSAEHSDNRSQCLGSFGRPWYGMIDNSVVLITVRPFDDVNPPN